MTIKNLRSRIPVVLERRFTRRGVMHGLTVLSLALGPGCGVTTERPVPKPSQQQLPPKQPVPAPAELQMPSEFPNTAEGKRFYEMYVGLDAYLKGGDVPGRPNFMELIRREGYTHKIVFLGTTPVVGRLTDEVDRNNPLRTRRYPHIHESTEMNRSFGLFPSPSPDTVTFHFKVVKARITRDGRILEPEEEWVARQLLDYGWVFNCIWEIKADKKAGRFIRYLDLNPS